MGFDSRETLGLDRYTEKVPLAPRRAMAGSPVGASMELPESNPRRRSPWLRFSLATFLIAVTVFCVYLAWRARREAFKLTVLPATVTVSQRSTTPIPGSNGKLVLTIDDITRNQVMASLATDKAVPVLPPQSMAPQDETPFRFGDATYYLRVKDLDNALIGEDYATFVIAATSLKNLTEAAKIELLIQSVANLQGATFIRNGVEYSADEAADHLRSKLRAAGGQIKTVPQFIDAIATESSASGKPYRIKMPGGKTVAAGAFLFERIEEIEGRPR
jgi:hypothetical protein